MGRLLVRCAGACKTPASNRCHIYTCHCHAHTNITAITHITTTIIISVGTSTTRTATTTTRIATTTTTTTRTPFLSAIVDTPPEIPRRLPWGRASQGKGSTLSAQPEQPTPTVLRPLIQFRKSCAIDFHCMRLVAALRLPQINMRLTVLSVACDF